MDFSYNETQRSVANAIEAIMADFGDDYWLKCDRDAKFPEAFYAAVAYGGWLGIAMPEAYGGANLGISEAAVMMQKVCDGGGMTAASTIHINIFGPHPIVAYGTEAQRQAWLPPLIKGSQKCCLAVTEPDAGLDTGNIKTKAERVRDTYVITGQKIWTTTAQLADKIMLLARTTAREDCAKSIDGLTLFYTDLDRTKIEVREIAKMGQAAVDSNQLFIDGLEVSEKDRIGEEGRGFYYLLASLNQERIIVAAEAIGIGKNALRRAVDYAGGRIAFGRPIGQNQSIQHPLARCWIELEAAELLTAKAAHQYDTGQNAGGFANAAKYFAAEAGFTAATQALLTLGGMGYAKEFHVERLLRESLIPRLTTVSSQMILNYISERILGLPRSY